MGERNPRRRWWVWLLVVIAFPAALWLPLGVSIVFLGFLILVVCFGDWDDPPTIAYHPPDQ